MALAGMAGYQEDIEEWIQCPNCYNWFHETCAGVYRKAMYAFYLRRICRVISSFSGY
jgi:hypothetical protein